MKPSPSKNYSYALDAANNIIHISSAVRGEKYVYPHCHAPMTPHMRSIKRWYFSHKANIENCNFETYLHKIAKSKIREAFINASTFTISFDVPAACERIKTCNINNGIEPCEHSIIKNYNLRLFYDKCEEETKSPSHKKC